MSNETNFPNNSNHPQSANIPTSSLAPFTRFCCSLGMIPSSYKASMSYEEQLMWLCDYLENTVIPTVNNNTDATNEIQELFNQLHDYVDNYFTNLDVQQEINNKLDTMADDGTLSTLLAPFVENNALPQFVNSTSDMTDTSKVYVLISSGNIFSYNGTSWVDTGYTYGVNELLFTGVPTAITSTEQLSDFNDALPNRCYAISTSDLAHMPETIGGTLLTFNRNLGDTIPAGYVQLYITSSTNNIYFRNYWNNDWKPWKKISKSSDFDLFFQAFETNSLTDFNDAVPNRCYYINATNLSNMPAQNGGCLITFNKTNTVTNGTIQYYLTSQSVLFYRIYWNNAWQNWTTVIKSSDLPNFEKFFQAVESHSLTDFNDAIPNRCYYINTTNLSNMPAQNGGCLITFNKTNTLTNGCAQYYLTSQLDLYYRLYWNNSWQNWTKIVKPTDLNVFFTGVFSTDFTNLDNASPNRCYAITNTSGFSNLPINSTGILIGFNRQQNNSTNGYIQYYITSSTNEIYYRILWSNSWKPWKKLINSDNIEDNLGLYSSIALFKTIGAVGDSWMSGVIFSYSTNATNNYALSWPQILARKNGIIATNYSRGGLRADTWLTSQYGLSKLLNDTAKNLYIIGLGLNDASALDNETISLGTINDIDINDPSNNANTFYGNYGKIISNIINHAPNAKIITHTIGFVRTQSHRDINTAIVAISQLFGIPCVISTDSNFFQSDFFFNQLISNHPTSTGYSGLAQVYEMLIQKCMVVNYSYFLDYTDSSEET